MGTRIRCFGTETCEPLNIGAAYHFQVTHPLTAEPFLQHQFFWVSEARSQEAQVNLKIHHVAGDDLELLIPLHLLSYC